MANANENTNPTPEKIEETGLAIPKEPVWKIILKVLGYVAAAAAGAVTTMLVSHISGDDDDDSPAEDTKE